MKIGNRHSLALPISRPSQRHHRSIKSLTIWLSLASAFISAIFISGCTGMPSAFDFSPNTEAPTYTQDKAVTLVEPFKIQIDNAYWTDRFEKPGYSSLVNMSQQYRKQLEAAYVAIPSAKFLVVEFTVSNLGREAASWREDKPPIFNLVNAGGFKYTSVGQDINDDDLTMAIVRGKSTMNPGMSIKGKVVFDVPKGEYLMHVSLGRHAGNLNFGEGATLFKWILNPSGV